MHCFYVLGTCILEKKSDTALMEQTHGALSLPLRGLHNAARTRGAAMRGCWEMACAQRPELTNLQTGAELATCSPSLNPAESKSTDRVCSRRDPLKPAPREG